MKIVTGNSTVVTSPVFADSAGVPLTLDADPTLEVTSDLGQTIDTSAVTAIQGSPGSYSVTVAPVDDPDLLTFTWTGAAGSSTFILQDTHDVVGGVYLNVAELAVLPDLDETKHPLSRRIDLRDEFEDIAERWTGKAWVPRYAKDRLPYATHLLSNLAVRSILAAVDGDDVAADFSDWLLEPWGLVTSTSGAPVLTGTWPYTVRYTHGADRPPVELKNACAAYVRAKALQGGNRVGRDVLSMTDPAGIGTQFSTPSWAQGRPTGFLDIDAVLTSLGAPLPGIA